MSPSDHVFRNLMVSFLKEANAHVTFEQAIANFPPEFYNARAENIPYTAWELLEHIRLAQWDILDFMRNPDYVTPNWPQDYWPERGLEADRDAWNATIEQIRSDLQAVQEIATNPDIDLQSELPHAPGYTYLREILLVIDHNAYHVGQLVTLRRALGIWQA